MKGLHLLRLHNFNNIIIMYYIMNFGALRRGLKASYMKNDRAEEELNKSGHTLNKDLSGERAKVYTDSEGRPTIAYRGTNNWHDVITDFALPLGLAQYTKRMCTF